MAVDQFYLIEAGFLYGSQVECSLLMDNSPQYRVIKLFKIFSHEQHRFSSCAAFDEFGREEFKTVTVSPGDPDLTVFEVTAATQPIGRVEIRNTSSGRKTLVQAFEEPANTAIQGCNQKFYENFTYEFNKGGEKKVCFMCNTFKGVVDIQINSNLKQNEKALLLCSGVFFSHQILKYHYSLPKLSISNLQPLCDNESKKTQLSHTPFAFSNLCQTVNIIISLAGHNSSVNRIYYNVYDQSTATVYATIEVTPIHNYQGYAQIDIKDFVGNVLFTAINFQWQGITAIYRRPMHLVGYIRKHTIYSPEGVSMMELVDVATTSYRTQFSQAFTHRYIHSSNSYTLAKENSINSGAAKIYIYGIKKGRELTYFEVFKILFLWATRTINLTSPETPTPEIEYYYHNQLPSYRGYIS